MKTWQAVVGTGLLILGASYLTFNWWDNKQATSCESMFESIEQVYRKQFGISVSLYAPYTTKEEGGLRYCSAIDKTDMSVIHYVVGITDDGEHVFWREIDGE